MSHWQVVKVASSGLSSSLCGSDPSLWPVGRNRLVGDVEGRASGLPAERPSREGGLVDQFHQGISSNAQVEATGSPDHTL